MSKLHKFREHLTIPEAARRLSISFEEEVSEADVLRLALDGHLRLSIDLVNGVTVQSGTEIIFDEAALKMAYFSGQYPKELQWVKLPSFWMAGLFPDWPIEDNDEEIMCLYSPRIARGRFWNASGEMTSIDGVWDLPMIGAEVFEIKRLYYEALDGTYVEPQNFNATFFEGIFLQRGSDVCQLLERRDFHLPSSTDDDPFSGYEPDKKFPEDSVLVVRTAVLRQFEQSLDDTPTLPKNPNVSKQLTSMIQASTKFWGNADRDDRGTHPDNIAVAAWLEDRGFTESLAKRAATIIRPEWAPRGRKPEE